MLETLMVLLGEEVTVAYYAVAKVTVARSDVVFENDRSWNWLLVHHSAEKVREYTNEYPMFPSHRFEISPVKKLFH